jgi:hypothetical protein
MLIDLEKTRDTDPSQPGVITLLYADDWVTFTAEVARFPIHWLNKDARIAVVHALFSAAWIDTPGSEAYKRTLRGTILAGPDGGYFLKSPGFAEHLPAKGVGAIALQLVADHVRKAPI